MIDLTVVARSRLLAGLTARRAGGGGCRRHHPSLPSRASRCARPGSRSDRCWILTAGLVDVLARGPRPWRCLVAGSARERRSARWRSILGEPYPETVVASIPTTALELDAADLLEMVRRFPRILVNVLRTAHGQLASARARSLERELGETVAVAAGQSLGGAGGAAAWPRPEVSPRPVTALDRDLSFAGALTAADQLDSAHATVLLPSALDAPTIDVLRREADRVVVARRRPPRRRPGCSHSTVTAPGPRWRSSLVGDEAQAATTAWPEDGPARVIRACPRGPDQGLADARPRVADPAI